MADRQRELKRIQTSAAYGLSRMGIPNSHPRGVAAYSPLFRQREFNRLAVFIYDDELLARYCA